MADQFTFEDLEQQYGLDAYRYDAGLRAPQQSYGGPSQYGNPYHQSMQANTPSVTPFWHPFPPPTDPQHALLPGEAAFMGNNFDFERAQAAGLMAASPPIPPAPATAMFPPTTYPGPSMQNIVHSGGNLDSEARYPPSTSQRLQPSGSNSHDVYAEPEAGKRVRLVPVTTLCE